MIKGEPVAAAVTIHGIAVITMITACSFDQGGLRFTDADSTDIDGRVINPADADLSRPDADTTSPDAGCPGQLLAITPSNIDKCDIPATSTSLDFGDRSWVINTSTGTLYDIDADTTVPLASTVVSQTTGGPDVRLVVADSIKLASDGFVWVSGTRPLVLVAYSDITIDGLLFVGADLDSPGPGGNLSSCIAGTGEAGTIQDDAGSGAGGGGYGSSGGGGARVRGAGGAIIAAAGGAENGNTAITPLRGGCAGGNGANNPGGGGAGGGGGGAIQLVAGGTITIGAVGAVSARGGGAIGTETQSPNADARAGGGGGGSGGAILLESTALEIAGALAANGGGGAEGTASGGIFVGQDGANGPSRTGDQALGGASINLGGDGGDGGALAGSADDGSQSDYDGDGSGGGGGGIGRIHFNTSSPPSVDGTAVISPAEE